MEHENIRKFIKLLGGEFQLVTSLVDGKKSLMELRKRITLILKMKKLLVKSEKNKASTDKWRKRHALLVNNMNNEVAQFLVHLNMAHAFQIAFFQNLYMAIKGISNKHNLPNNFLDILKTIDMLDSTDNERYVMFNRLRNSFFHSNLNRIIHCLDEQLIHEISTLLINIDNCNKALFITNEESFTDTFTKNRDIFYKHDEAYRKEQSEVR